MTVTSSAFPGVRFGHLEVADEAHLGVEPSPSSWTHVN